MLNKAQAQVDKLRNNILLTDSPGESLISILCGLFFFSCLSLPGTTCSSLLVF